MNFLSLLSQISFGLSMAYRICRDEQMCSHVCNLLGVLLREGRQGVLVHVIQQDLENIDIHFLDADTASPALDHGAA
jgi:hypothetical protein